MKKRPSVIISVLISAIGGAIIANKRKNMVIDRVKEMSEKHLSLFLLMNKWVKAKQEGKNLKSYFEKNNYKKIAIFGMSYVGETLLNELRGTSTLVIYGIDQKADEIYADIDVISVNEPLDEVDAIVVTAITYLDEIKEILSDKISCPIISLKDILDEI